MDLISINNIFSQHQWIIWLLLAWILPWKGIALWKSARDSRKIWFIALLLINTIGVLEILYIFYFSKLKTKKNEI